MTELGVVTFIATLALLLILMHIAGPSHHR